MVYAYYEIGRKIVEEEQNGENRAAYGKRLLKKLSKFLTQKYGKGYSAENLKLMRIDNIDERHFYEIEAVKNDWSLSELKRQCGSALYERLVLSTDKEKVYQLALERQKIETSKDAVKDPYVLEFLGLPELLEYSESELESRIIDHLQQFLLELGTGFALIVMHDMFPYTSLPNST